MVIIVVSEAFIPLDGPRPGVVGGLLPMGSANSPQNCGRAATRGVCEVNSRRGRRF